MSEGEYKRWMAESKGRIRGFRRSMVLSGLAAMFFFFLGMGGGDWITIIVAIMYLFFTISFFHLERVQAGLMTRMTILMDEFRETYGQVKGKDE